MRREPPGCSAVPHDVGGLGLNPGAGPSLWDPHQAPYRRCSCLLLHDRFAERGLIGLAPATACRRSRRGLRLSRCPWGFARPRPTVSRCSRRAAVLPTDHVVRCAGPRTSPQRGCPAHAGELETPSQEFRSRDVSGTKSIPSALRQPSYGRMSFIRKAGSRNALGSDMCYVVLNIRRTERDGRL